MLEMDIEHLLTVGVSIILASSYNVKQSCLFRLQVYGCTINWKYSKFTAAVI